MNKFLHSALAAATIVGLSSCDKLRSNTAAQAKDALAANPITMTAQAYNDSLGYYRDRTDLNDLSPETFQALVETRANLGSAGQELKDNLRPLPVFINDLKNSDTSEITEPGMTKLKISLNYGKNWGTMSCNVEKDGSITMKFPGGQHGNHEFLKNCTVTGVEMNGGVEVVTITGDLYTGVAGSRKNELFASDEVKLIRENESVVITTGIHYIDPAPQNPYTS